MRHLFYSLCFAFTLTACNEPASTPVEPTTNTIPAETTETTQTETERLNAWFDEKYDERLQQFHPISLTMQGTIYRY
jgi:hypothetical protein